MLILVTWFFFLHQIAAEQFMAEEWFVNSTTNSVGLTMGETKTVPFSVFINSTDPANFGFDYVSASTDIATINGDITRNDRQNDSFDGILNVTGVFLGTTKIKIYLTKDKVSRIIRTLQYDFYTISIV